MADVWSRWRVARAFRATALLLLALAPTIDPPMASSQSTVGPGPTLPSGTSARAVDFRSLAGWGEDDHLAAWRVFISHCRGADGTAPPLRLGATPPLAWTTVCTAARDAKITTGEAAKAFFMRWFTPHEIKTETSAGFLTGYYEPETDGSLERTSAYQAPLLARPADLVTIAEGETLPGVPAGFAAARGMPDGTMAVYPDRGAILDGGIAGIARPIAWLRDEVEVFFMQVQGSGRVRLPDSRTVRIAYAGRNGHPYTSIGRVIVQEGHLPLEQAKLDPLKAWLRSHPKEADRIMRMNRSYVFFRMADELPPEAGPIGGAGLPLTPWRSLAVDRTLWSYGLPVWIETKLPSASEGAGHSAGVGEIFHRLTIAEDTGSAIVGPARADLYHGSGAEAGTRAGALRHPMRFVVFLPRMTPLSGAP